MLRKFVFGLGAGLAFSLLSANAWAVSPGSHAPSFVAPQQSLIVQARQMTERQKCKALNRCRQKYTHCYNKLERQHKVDQKDAVCVPPYQKCINASFGGFDWFFTRWFNPSYLDCKQY